MNSTMTTPSDLRGRWEMLRAESPNLRIRDAARQLGTSEAELLATRIGAGVVRLEGEWGEFFLALQTLGNVMALTRNDHAVHEKTGIYNNLSVHGAMGLAVNEDIDLRIFFTHWRFGFAVEEETARGMRQSLQIFDRDGEAVHKVYLNEESDLNAYNAIVERFRSGDQSPVLPIEPVNDSAEETPDAEIDFPGLYADWYALQDTHDFFGLLKRFKVSRMQALRNAPSDLAWQVPLSALHTTLDAAVERGNPIMVFVGSRGVIQIHTGPIKRVAPTPPWINILDPGFNLHLREDAIASAWVVRKPTVDGNVTSLELFDAANETIALLFGKRKPGIQESEVWREIVESLERI